ncbi:MAG: alanine racemase [Nitrospirae bacterium GWD2_57_9]|nr:MAG: alanine racemase [Nitrospirae bacterium GWD2_57_9]
MRAPSTEASRERPAAESTQGRPDRPTEAEIDLNALTHNFRRARDRAAARKVLAVVKAQAYGHGAVAVARHVLKLGADMLGVALAEEGRELRDAGIESPVLVMGAVFPEQAETIVGLCLAPVVCSLSVARALSTEAIKQGTRLPVHVKIDSGMGRIGIAPEEGVRFIEELKNLEGIDVQGLMTHFADADLRDKEFSSSQLDRFEALIKGLEERGIRVPLRHAANSAALLDYGRALFTMVRPGIMLYGYDPLRRNSAELKPVLSLVTRIAFLKRVPAGTSISYGRTFMTRRESLIATIPIGYADGYNRGLSNRGEALVRGSRVPVVGRICMDMCMLDVTDVPGVSEGDRVTLIGAQGGERITAEDIADRTGTIAYEVLCGISSRVPRSYRE